MLQTMRDSWRRLAAVLLGALALCWAAALNGQPFFHPDTQAYVRGPDVAIMSVLGERFATPWALHDPGVRAPAPAGEAIGPQRSFQDDEVIAGRSLFYGLLPYLGERTGGFWLTVLLQGLAVAGLAEIVLRAVGARSLKLYAGVMGGLALLTAAPFFAGLLMPDVWAGIGIGSLAALFAVNRRLTSADRGVLAVLTVFSAMAHNSHVLVLAGLTAAGGVWWLLRRRGGPDGRLAVGAGVLAVVLALAGSAAFAAMVSHKYGKPPITPPFLTARVIADGPGTRWTREHCEGAAFEVCRYRDRLPLEVDDFLWAGDRKGVFETASPESRRALAEEQTRFAAAVFLTYPLSQTAASLRNALLQTGRMDLEDFRYKPSVRQTLESQLPEPHRGRMLKTLAAADAWPLGLMEAVQMLALVASVGVIGWSFAGGRRRPELSEALLFAGLVAAGVLLNGAICGAFSALHGRYQARVAWLLPLTAMVLLALSYRKVSQAPGSPES
jgi:hypothetical protein